jgi:hypothetical protein
MGRPARETSEAPLLAAALRRGFLAWSVVRAEEHPAGSSAIVRCVALYTSGPPANMEDDRSDRTPVCIRQSTTK